MQAARRAVQNIGGRVARSAGVHSATGSHAQNASPAYAIGAGLVAAAAFSAGLYSYAPGMLMPNQANADVEITVGGVNVMKNAVDLISRIDALELELAKRTNSAFVFIKPHAVNDKVVSLVKATLADTGIEVTAEGSLDYKTIDEKMLIDTHYGAIASKAVKVDPKDLAVTDKAKAAFKGMAGMSWEDALAKGLVYNAAGACQKMGIDGKQLDSKWSSINKKTDLVKFGGGFYVGKVGDIFVVNGFYMAMRGKFTEAPAKIHYFAVKWDAAALSWEDFRGKVLGATDPTTALEGSLRRLILDNWQKLGLASKPFTGDNGVHASASPFEALAERCNWLGADLHSDAFARALMAAGVSEHTITQWANDPQVKLGDGSKGSLFDALEDTNAAVCLEKAKKINADN